MTSYVDLSEGLEHHRLDRHADALWSWRFTFDAHWGDHLVDALRALRRINSSRGRDIVQNPVTNAGLGRESSQ